ncbi:HAMP domain-containing sensor histidine kinase [Adlercreutzia sp. R21]|uniref:sensor histidine kinase n=1 Tax=Adlercreutzia wanghongyangiae TaxID=3111451 RepID=UPI002DBC7D64|nr:HAMP domain-containing sensor histidine kinase [Adlercreutzia sp. R21]MEC4184027.1 HAMP domain-containing sensor histidine kinase [Adlercreutzia sp. R21]
MTDLLPVGLALAVAALAIGIAVGMRKARERQQSKRIEELLEYLEAAALGQPVTLSPSGEDDLSRLKDEIEKTVSALESTRGAAVSARQNYAHNLANIAHQIKTPATTIALAAERLSASGNSEVAGAADKIRAQITRLTVLQNQLLNLARIDAGVLRAAPSPLDTFSLLNDITDCTSERASGKGVTLDITNNEEVEILVDAHWTFEALSNIVENCIAHSPRQSTISIGYSDHPFYTEIHIRDCGPGLSTEDEKRLFERFYTGEHSSPGSTGLGLAFAREIIELQNGSIRARNMPNGGACFEIRFYRHFDVTLDA